jgi:septal ring factor EnvC (AmiA/AmiB activator)
MRAEPAMCACAVCCLLLQIRNEQLTNIVRKVQGECEFVLKQASTAAEKQEVLAAQMAKLTKSLEQTEERIKKAMQEAKVF